MTSCSISAIGSIGRRVVLFDDIDVFSKEPATPLVTWALGMATDGVATAKNCVFSSTITIAWAFLIVFFFLVEPLLHLI